MEKLTVRVDKNYWGDKYLFVFMPDGTKLPKQTELLISDKTSEKMLTVKFQYWHDIDNDAVHFSKGKYYFNGELIPGQKRTKKPIVVKVSPDSEDIFLKNLFYFIGQFSCTDFEFA